MGRGNTARLIVDDEKLKCPFDFVGIQEANHCNYSLRSEMIHAEKSVLSIDNSGSEKSLLSVYNSEIAGGDPQRATRPLGAPRGERRFALLESQNHGGRNCIMIICREKFGDGIDAGLFLLTLRTSALSTRSQFLNDSPFQDITNRR